MNRDLVSMLIHMLIVDICFRDVWLDKPRSMPDRCEM